MPWPFDREYMQLALVAGLIVGACAPLIGSFLVPKRMSLLGDGLGHVAFAGVGGGLLLDVWPVWTALAAAVVCAVVMERLRARGRAGGDLALALFFYSGIAAGVVLASSAGAINQAGTYLFGQILTVSRGDVAVIVVLGALIVVTLGVCGRALFATVVDEESARVAGVPVDALNSVLAALAAVTVVAAMRVVGVLLVATLMVLPVASGQLLGRSFRASLGWSVGVGTVSVVVGLGVARAWGLAPGGTIVLTAAAVFAALSAGRRFRPRAGLVVGEGPQLTSPS